MSQDYQDAIREASAVVDDEAREVFVEEVAKYVTAIDPANKDATLKEILDKKGGPGQPRRVISRKMKNVLFNWKKVMLEAMPALIGTVVALKLKPSGAYLSALKFFQSIRGVTDVDLSDNHAKTVRFLWVERASLNPVKYADLSDNMASKLEKTDISTVLEDLLILELIRMDGVQLIWKIDEFILE
jgi:hypothetical protein